MKTLVLLPFLFLFLFGCSNKNNLQSVRVVDVKLEDLVDKPDRDSLRLTPEKQYLTKGMTNGEIITVLGDNNLRSEIVDRRLQYLQQYVCNLFKDPAGEVCSKKP